MDKKDVILKSKEMFSGFITDRSFIDAVNSVLQSGCIDLDSYENNYYLPKLLLQAYLGKMYYQFDLGCKQKDKTLINIERFI